MARGPSSSYDIYKLQLSFLYESMEMIVQDRVKVYHDGDMTVLTIIAIIIVLDIHYYLFFMYVYILEFVFNMMVLKLC